ncbi:hypothetical protein [Microbacterium sp.]|uniref:hypothetical protein n=1 Tax=Microbacterium sp. TaxID=51671 RepID=UPI00260964DB|nr:hypothetical protein [Microbacterium sp.]
MAVLGVAAALVIGAPVAAAAYWGATAPATLSIAGAPFGITATNSGPSSATMTSVGGAATQADVAFVVSSVAGAPQWSASAWIIPGHNIAGIVTTSWAASKTATSCDGLTYTEVSGGAVTLPALADGATALVCVRVSMASVPASADGKSVYVSFMPYAQRGGWSATASAYATVHVEYEPVPVGICEPTTDPWYVGYEDAVDFLLPDGAPYLPVEYTVRAGDPVWGQIVKSFSGDELGNNGRPTLGSSDLQNVDPPLPLGTYTFYVIQGGTLPVAQFTATLVNDMWYPNVVCGEVAPW